jgi:uncharacterized phage protein (TIGR01671 family)
MREIKFRGKNIETNEWIFGYLNKQNAENKYYITSPTKSALYNHCHTVKEETIGQYTGLKDKNGKEIYEGDIVKGKDDAEFKEIIGTIEWVDNWAQFVIEANQGHYNFIDFRCNGLEIIGNIYDNPELLEEK